VKPRKGPPLAVTTSFATSAWIPAMSACAMPKAASCTPPRNPKRCCTG
jgi:hypothetical protein